MDHSLNTHWLPHREGRSTEIALHHLVSKVEELLETKGYATDSFLDITGASDSSCIGYRTC